MRPVASDQKDREIFYLVLPAFGSHPWAPGWARILVQAVNRVFHLKCTAQSGADIWANLLKIAVCPIGRVRSRDPNFGGHARLYLVPPEPGAHLEKLMADAPGPLLLLPRLQTDVPISAEGISGRLDTALLATTQKEALKAGLGKSRVSRHLPDLIPARVPAGCTVLTGAMQSEFLSWVTRAVTGSDRQAIRKSQRSTQARTRHNGRILIHTPPGQTNLSGAIAEALGPAFPTDVTAGSDLMPTDCDPPSRIPAAVIDLSPPHSALICPVSFQCGLLGIPVVARAGLWTADCPGRLIAMPANSQALDYSLVSAHISRQPLRPGRADADPVGPPPLPARVKVSLPPSPTEIYLNRLEAATPVRHAPADAHQTATALAGLSPPADWLAQDVMSAVRVADLRTALLVSDALDLEPAMALARFGFAAPVLSHDDSATAEEQGIAEEAGLRLVSIAALQGELNTETRAAIHTCDPAASPSHPLVVPVADAVFHARVPVELFDQDPGMILPGNGYCWRRDAACRTLDLWLLTPQSKKLRLNWRRGLGALIVEAGDGGQLVQPGGQILIRTQSGGVTQLRFEITGKTSRQLRADLYRMRRILARSALTLTLCPDEDGAT